MPLLNIEMMKTLEVDDGVVKCSVCKAEMKPVAISLKNRLVRLLIGRNTTITHYQCPDCKKELITLEK